ncbi:DUF3721 domain-containing protein [Cyanobium sp. Morenito 9A2]|uniref:DUF3721 domain-containing protein n=1 Tax=Cyanobium sp. Morenito 9A2 TaxID=2823718 RepID=UPI0020CBE8FB|nr:DUF3721 domain-containing protein [Cyanobium sp. Morenito 9A2]
MASAVRAGAPPAANGAAPAVFATQAAAEAAAPRFGCKGAHRMGDTWMPCASHGETRGGAHPGMNH